MVSSLLRGGCRAAFLAAFLAAGCLSTVDRSLLDAARSEGGDGEGGADADPDGDGEARPDADGEAGQECGNGAAEPGEECDDGNSDDDDGCTVGCVFSCHDPAGCDDGDACTADDCVAAGAGRACSRTIAAGAPCDDGLFCTAVDACDAGGACTGAGDTCADTLSCTASETCDEDTDACTFVVAAGSCAIDGACRAEGEHDPANACSACRPAILATAWTGEPDFAPCSIVTSPDRGYDICAGGVCVSPGCGDASCNSPGPNFHLPDTGQRSCAGGSGVIACPGTPGDAACGLAAFCGQDAQYGWDTTHAPADRFVRSERVAGEPAVADAVTGLVWQGCPAGLRGAACGADTPMTRSWEDALVYCEMVEWGGYDDWRLPDVHELLSIADRNYAGTPPAIDPDAFPATPGSWFWASSIRGATSTAWMVGFGVGDVGDWDRTAANNLRCVRSDPGAAALGPRFERTGTDTDQPVVADTVTGLVWQGCAAGLTGAWCAAGGTSIRSWQSALAYCQTLTWAGDDDWRLPDANELAGIVDHRRGNFAGSEPTVDPVAFPATPASGFWSSTPSAQRGDMAWGGAFDTGHVGGASKTDLRAVRCVRDGG